MKLAKRLGIALILGVFLVLAAFAYVRLEREVQLFDSDMRREPLSMLVMRASVASRSALASVPGLLRVRLSSLDPGDVTDELLAVMASRRACAPHLHLPLLGWSYRALLVWTSTLALFVWCSNARRCNFLTNTIG